MEKNNETSNATMVLQQLEDEETIKLDSSNLRNFEKSLKETKDNKYNK